MNKHPYHIDTLKAYLAGKLDGKSMHEIEKRALEDPFLADALEGLNLDNKASLEGLTDLQQALYNRVHSTTTLPQVRKKRGHIRRNWWFAAAAIVIAGLGSLYIFKLQTPTENKRNMAREIAQGAVNPSPSAIAPKSPVANQDSVELARSDNNGAGAFSHNIAKSDKDQKKTEASASILLPQKKRPAVVVQSQNKVRDQQAAISKEEALAGVASPGIMDDNKVNGDSSSTAMGATAYAKMDAITEAGPIRAAKASVPELNRSIVAILPVTDSVKAASPGAKLSFDQRPMQKQPLTVSSMLQGQLAGLNVRRNKATLNDVVVVGYGQSSKKRINGSSASNLHLQPDNIHPIGGREAFDSYIADQVQKLRDNSSLQDTGTVLMQFTLPQNGQGKPEKIKILKGAGRKLNKRAKKLLQNGPDWQPDSNSDTHIHLPFKGSYTIVFR